MSNNLDVQIKTKANIFCDYSKKDVDWYKERDKGIGGSDAAAVCGVSHYETAIGVWMKKKGLKKTEQNECMEWGTLLEDVIAKKFFEKAKNDNIFSDKETMVSTTYIYQSKDYPFMLANIDRLILDDEGKILTFVECKNVSHWRESEFEGELIPDEYMIQIQHYMAVLELDYCYLAYLIDGNHHEYKKVLRDEDLISMIIVLENQFNDLLKSDEMPEPSGNDYDNLQSVYKKTRKEVIGFEEDEQIELVNLYAQKKEELSNLENEVDEIKNKIVSIMKENEEAIAGKYRLYWKPTNKFNEEMFKSKYADIVNDYSETITEIKKDKLKKEKPDIYNNCVSFAYRKLTYKQIIAD